MRRTAVSKHNPIFARNLEKYDFIMADLSQFDPNSVGLLSNNVFGLPFSEEEARLVLLPVPWEVTVSYNNGTARGPEHIFRASFQVDLYDADVKDGWKQGFYMREPDKHLLLRSDYLRKEAELYLKFLTEVGFSGRKPNNGSQENLTKITVGPALSTGPDFWKRPELRLYVTYADFNKAAAQDAQNGLPTNKTNALSYGAQVEIWF